MVDKLATNIEAALRQFKNCVPRSEGDRWKLQTSIHGDEGKYKTVVFNHEPLVTSVQSLINKFEDSCISILRPLDKNTDLNGDKEIKSVISNRRDHSLPLEVLAPDRSKFVNSLANMREAAEQGFVDGVCAHDLFSSDKLSVHMPGRFSGDRTDWDNGYFTCDSVRYVLPVGNSRFAGNETNRNIVVDTKNRRYFVRDNSGVLCEYDSGGALKKEIRQGSLGDSISDVKTAYRTLLKV